MDIFAPVSSCNLFMELPLGPSSFPTKLNCNRGEKKQYSWSLTLPASYTVASVTSQSIKHIQKSVGFSHHAQKLQSENEQLFWGSKLNLWQSSIIFRFMFFRSDQKRCESLHLFLQGTAATHVSNRCLGSVVGLHCFQRYYNMYQMPKGIFKTIQKSMLEWGIT